MGAPTLNAQVVAIVSFLAIMFLLQPVLQTILPANLNSQLYGANGIVTTQYSNYNNAFGVPVLATANSNQGIGAITTSGLASFGGLAFMYNGLFLFYQNIVTLPNVIYFILTGTTSTIAFLPGAIEVIITLIIGYIVVGDAMKFISYIGKTDIENVGS